MDIPVPDVRCEQFCHSIEVKMQDNSDEQTYQSVNSRINLEKGRYRQEHFNFHNIDVPSSE